MHFRITGRIPGANAAAPLAEWGRWVLDDRPDRPIAPGFTITPAEADKLVAAPAGAH